MKTLPLWFVFIAVLGIGVGCERDLPYSTPPDEPISGYRLEGYVTDRLGIPLKGIRIALWYEFDYIDKSPAPPREFFVDDSTKPVRVKVLDQSKRTIRILFDRRGWLGSLQIEWDKKDSLGKPVPTGIYTVDFTVADVSRGSYLIAVNGAVTTSTDSLGHYSIPNELLPVGFSPVPLYNEESMKFLGNYIVSSFVVLELYLDVHRSAAITLTKNQVTRFDFRI